MAIAGVDIRIAGVHVEIALRLVEGNRRQRARLDIGEEFVGPRRLTQAAVAQVPGARRGAGGELDEIVERLVVRLEIGSRGKLGGVGMARPPPVPAAGIPCTPKKSRV